MFSLRKLVGFGQTLHPLAHIGHAHAGNVGDGQMLGGELHVPRSGVKARAFAMRAHLFNQVFNLRLGKTLLAAFLIVIPHRVVKNFSLVFRQLHTGAYTLRAPTVLAVVAEQTRIEFVVRSAANGACSECGEHLQLANVIGFERGLCPRSFSGLHGFL